ncbi:MAG TPA: LysR substrate-binding domain-containing protein, partial [Gillisia sp.]|nr:LysR substrate-binding domain-containing protein [Gillisia sp.]
IMNLQQLEYVIAVDTQRHFAKAAEKSFVTQATLSMMIKKLEDELEIKIFDRSRQPVTPTKEGEEFIKRAKQVLTEVGRLKDFAFEIKGEITGELHIGIIPTLAPYLLPLFLKSFIKKYPQLKIFIREMITDEVIRRLKMGELDIGLVATPLDEPLIKEYPLFYEEFFAYSSRGEKYPDSKYLMPKDIDLKHLWLLEEGHCLRNQVINFCELKKKEIYTENLHYEAGSIETLINLVDKYEGVTIIPHLAMLSLKAGQKKNIKEFANPKPVREISIIVGKNFARVKLLEKLKEEITSKVPFKEMLKSKNVLAI